MQLDQADGDAHRLGFAVARGVPNHFQPLALPRGRIATVSAQRNEFAPFGVCENVAAAELDRHGFPGFVSTQINALAQRTHGEPRELRGVPLRRADAGQRRRRAVGPRETLGGGALGRLGNVKKLGCRLRRQPLENCSSLRGPGNVEKFWAVVPSGDNCFKNFFSAWA